MHCSCPIGAQVWRRVVVAVVSASSYALAWTISWLWFGLSDQLLVGALSLEKGVPPFVWLSSLGFASGMILFQGEGARRVASSYGWVTIVMLSMVKRVHPSVSNNSLLSLILLGYTFTPS